MFSPKFRLPHFTHFLVFQLSLLCATFPLSVAGCDENSVPREESVADSRVVTDATKLVRDDSTQMAIPRDFFGDAISSYEITVTSKEDAINVADVADTGGPVAGSTMILATAERKGVESFSGQFNTAYGASTGRQLLGQLFNVVGDLDWDGYSLVVGDSTANDIGPNRPASFGSRNAVLWEYEEWSVQNSSYSGNPFDVIATVTFNHQKGSKTHTTEMFYDGRGTWKFRFTGTRTGTWTFTTSSDDSKLDGLTGSVEVNPNPDSDAYGFTKKSSVDPQKWAREKGSPGQEETFVPQLVMWKALENVTGDPTVINQDVQTFFEGHGFNGFHVPLRPSVLLDSSDNPDLALFEDLETVIRIVHNNGGHVHLWNWGDAQRGWTPPGGTNSSKHKRFQGYLAARLGPLPGWSAGLGFDLNEWVTASQLHTWRDYLQGKMGWFHFLGGRPAGPNSGTDHSPWHLWNSGVDYSSWEHHEPTYDIYRAAITEVAGQPVMSEDRFRVTGGGAGKDYTNEQTRRGLYLSTMAGGVANIWGNLNTGSYDDGSGSYPNKGELKTYSTFFFEKGRFLADMQASTSITDGRALVDDSSEHYVFYKQNTPSVQVDLSEMNSSQPVIAVDAKGLYQEVDLGTVDPTSQIIILPYSSDWVIAVGQFD